ncbi:DUF1108 family protein [Staphylococcus xylosus]|uniref:DUF1108 family protein n=1 Tax=Staphylococcus xylosus TaxID=1288 RepID=UPI001CDBE912|nr:DUF1108 family protein [Staphylococcus xylosus]UBV34096.1 DUF1108 family protein [Staphylococcus xylosus]
MYYEIGYEKTKEKYIHGFKFHLFIVKLQGGVYIEFQDYQKNFIADMTVTDLDMGIQEANHALEYHAMTWIEENTDLSDKIISDVMQW